LALAQCVQGLRDAACLSPQVRWREKEMCRLPLPTLRTLTAAARRNSGRMWQKLLKSDKMANRVCDCECIALSLDRKE
jgi:hypothetical protein